MRISNGYKGNTSPLTQLRLVEQSSYSQDEPIKHELDGAHPGVGAWDIPDQADQALS